MPEPAVPEVAGLLRAARWRVIAQALVAQVGRSLLLAGGALVVFSAVERWGHYAWWSWALALAVAGGAVVLAIVWTMWQTPALPALARELDRRGQTHDRLTTALAFAESEAAGSPMHGLALRECAAYLQGRDFRALLPWHLPAGWRWLLVPVVALALVRWDLHVAGGERARLQAAAQEKTEPTVEALRALAREIEKAANKSGDAELKKLAAEIARRAEALKAASTDPAAGEKAALRELSALEQLAQDMQRPPAPSLSPEELQALAAALAKAEALQAAAEKLRAGDTDAAARELEKAAQNEAEAAKAEAALRQALQHLAEQKSLSEASERQLAPAPGSATESALQKLADMLRKMPSSAGGKPGSQKGSQQSLENLLAALQNLKFGEPPPHGSPKPGGENGPPPESLQVSPAPPGGESQAGAQIPIPGGKPGGDMDPGTTDSPFGRRQDSAAKGGDLALRGQQNDQGEVFSQSLPGGTDASRATRQYQQLYQALAPAAENAILQEDIPLGSRLYIKRYFESIRPTQ